MAIEELSPDQEGRRFHVISLGAGLDAEDLRELLGYKKVSSVYLLLNGKQRLTLAQMKVIAKACAGKGEWMTYRWFDLFHYLQGAKRLGFQDAPDDGGLDVNNNSEVISPESGNRPFLSWSEAA